MTAVKSVIRSPLSGWIGGKYRLCKRIVERIPEHTCYAEPFAGGAWVMLAKPPEMSKVEVLNDINRDVVNLYRVLQHHLEEFIRQFKWALTARAEFERQLRVEPDTLTDIQRAARFYYIQKLAFAGRISGTPSFAARLQRPSNLNLLRIEEELSQVHLRLARVAVENMNYPEFIKRYDRPETFYYIDPPYYGCEHYYGPGFSRDDFEKLRDMLVEAKSKWLLSINDVEPIRKLFAGYTMEPVQVRYSAGMSSKDQFPELLIRNY